MKTNMSYGRSPSASAPSFVPVVRSLGFTSAGIAAGSWAAGHMSSYGGVVSAGSPCAVLQSVGATGTCSPAGVTSLVVATTAGLGGAVGNSKC